MLIRSSLGAAWIAAAGAVALWPGGLASQRERPTPASASLPNQALAAITPQLLEAHLRFLADDALEGRAPGTRGGDLAARYLQTQLAALGLRPGSADASFYQWVPLVGLRTEASVVVGTGRQTLVLEPGEDFVAWPERTEPTISLDADIVFAGYGIGAPQLGWDDYAGTPQTGRIVLLLGGPGQPPGDSTRSPEPPRGRYRLWTSQLEQAARMGAVGVFLIHQPGAASLPWDAVRSTWGGEHLLPDRPPEQSLRFAAWLTSEAARRVVEAAGIDYPTLVARSRLGNLPPVRLRARAAVDLRSRVRRFQSPNVIARLDGADSTGRGEAVVVAAHYDHLGTHSGAKGDTVYPGAVDNAAGLAVMLGAATALRHAGAAPRRTVLFLALTASEAGWLGSRAYLQRPALPLERTAALINVDGANVWGRTRDLLAYGADLSTLAAEVSRAAAAESLRVATDPFPEAANLYRSDQIVFADAGIPVLLLRPGTDYLDRSATRGVQPWQAYLDSAYHRPADQARPDFDYRGAVQQARVLARLVWSLAQSAEWPRWLPEAEFGPQGRRLRPQH